MRYILVYPLDVDTSLLHNVKIIDIRKCKFTEIDIQDDPSKVIEKLGEPIEIVDTSKIRKSFDMLFFNCRFWEAHEVLEEKWKANKNTIERKYLQALILICASMIKYQKGQKEISDKLLSDALSLISELPEDLLPLLYVRFCLYP
ncbi:DUF309 domain-containing protein [Acidianus sulfidivorans JP7]|uniref:DUF309 domain-containing protein n=2 Tax=Acidianus TaxID=12914 RepID=A0A2U9ING5_9CREN|nr:DUF309 domain-containing protein [Acidianus sulfidivorans JP7]